MNANVISAKSDASLGTSHRHVVLEQIEESRIIWLINVIQIPQSAAHDLVARTVPPGQPVFGGSRGAKRFESNAMEFRSIETMALRAKVIGHYNPEYGHGTDVCRHTPLVGSLRFADLAWCGGLYAPSRQLSPTGRE